MSAFEAGQCEESRGGVESLANEKRFVDATVVIVSSCLPLQSVCRSFWITPPPVLQWLALLKAHTVCGSLNRQQTVATQPKHYDGLFAGGKKTTTKKGLGDRCAGEA